MTTPTPAKFYLVHVETGQRYAVVNDDVVIGRSGGDILFPDDMKLSHQHCRVVMTAAGLGIHDLGSANGTIVDGKRLAPDKVYAFKPGALVQAGGQQFTLAEMVSRARPRKKRVKAPPEPSVHFGQLFLAVLALGALGFTARLYYRDMRRPANVGSGLPVAMETPFELVDKELYAVIDQYRQLGVETQSGKLDDKKLAQKIRTQVLPSCRLVHEKLGAIRPQGEYQRQSLELKGKLSAALVGQLTAMAEHAETHAPAAAAAMKTYADELEKISAQMSVLKKSQPPPALR